MAELGEIKNPRTQRMPREARRRQLLQAAHQVFVAHGYHGASMDEIAEVALVSKPVLYQHFPGKRELYLALLDSHLADFTKLLDDAISSTNENRQRVFETINTYYQYIKRESQAYRLIFESDVLSDPLVAARIEEFNNALATSISKVVVKDTDLDEDEGLLVGRALAGLSQVSARYWATSGEPVDQETAVDLISRLAWRGISRFPKEN
ncbi:TetR/AcrR family transcriptional regulator [Arthrobacter sp. MYb211]|uniref:TetR/AcrR family transcriptional regulator n=1 Tax=Micrococcaceae TaxID=1268 RepID=UPI000BB9B43B|nr:MULTISPECIES: TetR/AcrR family transcriptional regulator [Micrococcaceae]PCC29457.1 TetR family transcriptional regulator [Glutamicibacter sp. BW80]PQZ99254.1 TetR/AcrR family transcriptional regulator [Arthrobacter sp. MYb224]PRA06264.1 TetR/AcrR family transcriptional regulator [Arthrobacter sp. MYb229]PRA12800.1 TetR/AcrR family transcriptional regulator [Arthrobacter sp. MYb221]PRB53166.1 TetR/AcrR family transcriptional regulator [Arthrobacter sp. MYb216]